MSQSNLIIYTTEESPTSSSPSTLSSPEDPLGSKCSIIFFCSSKKLIAGTLTIAIYEECFCLLFESGLNQCKLLDRGTIFFKGSTCLVEACLNRDMGMIDLLLKYGARDDDCKVSKFYNSWLDLEPIFNIPIYPT